MLLLGDMTQTQRRNPLEEYIIKEHILPIHMLPGAAPQRYDPDAALDRLVFSIESVFFMNQ